jgi:hypothetical protein
LIWLVVGASLVGLVSRNRQRGCNTQRRVARGADEQAVLERGVGERERRSVELDREQQARAAHAVERRLEPRADLAHVLEQVVVDRVHDRAGGRARDRVAAEGRVIARTTLGLPSATSSAPIGRPFASPFASVTASGRTPLACQA